MTARKDKQQKIVCNDLAVVTAYVSNIRCVYESPPREHFRSDWAFMSLLPATTDFATASFPIFGSIFKWICTTFSFTSASNYARQYCPHGCGHSFFIGVFIVAILGRTCHFFFTSWPPYTRSCLIFCNHDLLANRDLKIVRTIWYFVFLCFDWLPGIWCIWS